MIFNKHIILVSIAILLSLYSCNTKDKNSDNTELDNYNTLEQDIVKIAEPDTVIIDSNISFEEAMQGTKAPQSVIDQLVIIDVQYISIDNKIHQGQIVTNSKLEGDIKHMFDYMLENNFVIEKVIPIVAYNWSDSLSMDDNNSYSFCYRNVSYSKHAYGTAIDINPRFNPLRWKKENRPNQPEGAVLDTTVNGTLHPNHMVVEEFRRLGYRWGHTFSRYFDDHHFEKR